MEIRKPGVRKSIEKKYKNPSEYSVYIWATEKLKKDKSMQIGYEFGAYVVASKAILQSDLCNVQKKHYPLS